MPEKLVSPISSAKLKRYIQHCELTGSVEACCVAPTAPVSRSLRTSSVSHPASVAPPSPTLAPLAALSPPNHTFTYCKHIVKPIRYAKNTFLQGHFMVEENAMVIEPFRTVVIYRQ